MLQEWRRQTDDPNLGVTYQFRNGRPTQLTQFVVPTKEWDRISPDLGLFAQDQWTIKRLTLNLGLRFDYLRGYVPAQHLPAGPFVPGARLRGASTACRAGRIFAAPQRRLRSVRQQQDGGEGELRAVCRPAERDRPAVDEQPGADDGEKRDARLDRRQQRFHSAGERARAALELATSARTRSPLAIRPTCSSGSAPGTTTGRRV